MKKKVKIESICLRNLTPTDKPATEKQINFILGLLFNKKVISLSKEDCNRLTIKVASKLIDCLLQNKLFKILDFNKIREYKLKKYNVKQNAKQEEREKFSKIRNQVVKPIPLIKKLPKTFNNIPKININEMESRLNNLINKL